MLCIDDAKVGRRKWAAARCGFRGDPPAGARQPCAACRGRSRPEPCPLAPGGRPGTTPVRRSLPARIVSIWCLLKRRGVGRNGRAGGPRTLRPRRDWLRAERSAGTVPVFVVTQIRLIGKPGPVLGTGRDDRTQGALVEGRDGSASLPPDVWFLSSSVEVGPGAEMCHRNRHVLLILLIHVSCIRASPRYGATGSDRWRDTDAGVAS